MRLIGLDCVRVLGARREHRIGLGGRRSAHKRKASAASIAVSPTAKYFVPMQLPYPFAHSFPLILAPMAGVSEAPFRQICRAMGADVVLSEFLSSEAIRRRIRNTFEGAEFEEIERPIGIQIYGANPEAMAEAAGLITEHYRPEFIDINFGCPVKKVVQRNGGSGCLRDLELVQRIIRMVIGATHLPVTVKTRSGWSDDTRDPVGIALRMQDAGARAFTLHARTRTQMFSGKARWDEIARVVEALEIPVIGNGDLMTAEDVVRMRDHTQCAGVMVGRGAFGNPWLFRDSRALLAGQPAPPPPSAAERFAVALHTPGSRSGFRVTPGRPCSSSGSTSGGIPRGCTAPATSGNDSSRSSRSRRPSPSFSITSTRSSRWRESRAARGPAGRRRGWAPCARRGHDSAAAPSLRRPRIRPHRSPSCTPSGAARGGFL